MPQNHHMIPLDPHMHQNPPSPGCEKPPHDAPTVRHGSQDTATWHASQYFEITEIRPENPFFRPLPFPASSETGSFRANSGPIKPHTRKVRYNVTFKFQKDGIDVFRDPHFDGDG